MGRRKLRLWLLEAIEEWKPWYDSMMAIVVTAESEEAARQIAQSNGGDETRKGNVWLDAKLTRCELLVPRTEPGIVISDVREA